MIPVIAAGIAFVWGLASGCGGSDDADTTKPQPDTDVPPRPDAKGDAYVADSADGYISHDADAFIPSPDAESDTDANDVGPDLEVSGPDADAVSDTTTSPDADTTSDIGPDAEPDAVPDTKPDVIPDVVTDADMSVPPDVIPDTDTSLPPDTSTPDVGPDANEEVDVAPVQTDNDGDGVLSCTSEALSSWMQGIAVLCDCNDENAFIYPGAAQALVNFDTNCNGNTEVDVNKDAVKFVGNYQYGAFGGQNMALGDVNHDGYADIILASPNDSDVDKWPDVDNGKVYIFFGGMNKFKLGTTLTMDKADVIITGGANWGLGGSLIAVPNYGDTNGDNRVDGSDFCDLMIAAGGYNLFESGNVNSNLGEGDGVSSNGKAAAVFVKGRANWQAHYSFYNIPNVNDEVIVNGHNAESLAQHQMGVIISKAAGFNISWGPAFGQNVNEGNLDVILGESNSAQLHLISAQEYLGIQWIDKIRTTWVKDFNFSSNIARKGAHQLGDINNDGRADLVLSDSENDSSGEKINGRVTLVKGQQNIPEEIILPDNNGPVVDQSNNPLPYIVLSGAQSNDLVGTGIVIAELDDADGADLAIGASNQSGENIQSGCIPVLFSDKFNPEYTGINIGLNSDIPNYDGVVLDGDTDNSHITQGGALQSFNNGGSHSVLIFGAPNHPNGARFYVGDMALLQGMNQVQISTSLLPQVTGPVSFGSGFSNGADTNKSGAQSVLVGAPRDVNDHGAAYLFPGVPQ